MQLPYIVGIGALNLDIMCRSTAALIPQDSNPGSIAVSIGGVTHNVLENARRLGVPVRLISAIGDDLFAETLRKGCAQSGIPTDDLVLFTGQRSSCYLSTHEPNGEMSVAVSDMHILQNLTPAHLAKKAELLNGAAAILFDTGLPETVIDFLIETYGGRVPLFVDPVSTTYAHKLRRSLRGIHTIKPNILEAEILSDMKIENKADLEEAARRICRMGAERVFISLGREGVLYADQTGKMTSRRCRPLDRVANATGAGDSFLGALLWAYTEGFDLEATLDAALTAAVLTIQSEHTIRPDMSCDLLTASLPLYRENS